LLLIVAEHDQGQGSKDERRRIKELGKPEYSI
jgi:hypothetical protein